MTRRTFSWLALGAAAFALACEEPAPQDPSELQTTYQNGYPQTSQQVAAQPPAPAGVTYAPNEPPAPAPVASTGGAQALGATQAAPEPIQTTPVPVGVQALPPPTAIAPTPPAPATPSMAVPGAGAFVCTSDAQCLLGRCNVRYGRCAYPCRSSALDCKAGNVCTAAGLCMPHVVGGVGM